MGTEGADVATDNKFQAKVKQIRDLKSKGSGFEVQAMNEILELEKTSVLWRRDDIASFDDVLREEKGLCTPGRFKDYKRAKGHFSFSVIEKLGVACVCLLAKQPAQARERILAHALKYRSDNGSEPTYQYVCMFLRKKTNGPTRSQLLKYNELLKSTIKDLGGRVPRMEDAL